MAAPARARTYYFVLHCSDMSAPRSVRFDPRVLDRLSRWVAAHPGTSASGAANRLVDEALRSEEHPGIIFQSGPAGRRATLVGGPDVWEVIKVLGEVRAADPRLRGSELVTATAESLGLPAEKVRIAVHYYGEYAEEIDALIEAAEDASRITEAAWRVEQRLLA